MEIKIALAGNPNCGKTTLFNALTGSSQYVGNWPGVTVEKKEGRLKGNKDVVIQDLPGIYSLSPYTLEEVVARSYLVNEKPDAILNIVDGTNIERNLYLTTQLIELGIPVVVAVNMIDLVRKNGDKIDLKRLGEALGCDVVEMSALKNEGGMEAARRCVAAAQNARQKVKRSCPMCSPAAWSMPLPTLRSPSPKGGRPQPAVVRHQGVRAGREGAGGPEPGRQPEKAPGGAHPGLREGAGRRRGEHHHQPALRLHTTRWWRRP